MEWIGRERGRGGVDMGSGLGGREGVDRERGVDRKWIGREWIGNGKEWIGNGKEWVGNGKKWIGYGREWIGRRGNYCRLTDHITFSKVD